MPAQPDSITGPQASQNDQDDPEDLADLTALAGALKTLGLAALLLAPSGKPPWIDVRLRGVLKPGEKIRAQAGMFFWQAAEPIGPSDQPDAAAATIARALQRPATSQ
jgi:hypothetical protein